MDINGVKVCERCFKVTKEEPCPYCGYSKKAYQTTVSELPVGTVLKDRYHIGMVLGKGGFGVTYMAYDDREKALTAIKEYYPNGMVHRNTGDKSVTLSNSTMSEDFKTGAEKFYDEAKTVSRFNGNPNIVGVRDCFYENGTVYYAMEYLEGMDLKHYIKKSGGRLSQENVLQIANIITDALLITHSMNVIHRDISPDNIYVMKNGDVKLIDFGAARQVLSNQSHSLSVILKQGFAPIEQYQRKGKQGPWTDIYALGATLYYALTGNTPEDATERLDDPSLGAAGEYAVDEALWKIIKKAMEVKKEDRYQNIMEMKADLGALTIGAKPLAPIEESVLKTNAGMGNQAGAGNETVAMDQQAGETVMFDQPVTPVKKKDKIKYVKILGTAAAAMLLLVIIIVAAVNISKNKEADVEVAVTETSGTETQSSEISEAAEQSYTDEVLASSNIMVDSERNAWFIYKNKLYNAPLKENGDLENPSLMPLGEIETKDQSLIADGSNIYVGESGGLYTASGGQWQLWIVDDTGFWTTFYLYDDTFYYLKSKAIHAVKRDGSNDYQVAENVDKFTVTEEGVYYTDDSGNFMRCNLDGGQTVNIQKVGEKAYIYALGKKVFAWKDKIYCYDIETKSCELFSEQDFKDNDIVAWGNYLLYSDPNYDSYRYDMTTGQKVGIPIFVQNAYYCTIYDNKMYKNVGDSIRIYDLESNIQINEIDLTNLPKNSMAGGSETKPQQSPSATSGNGDYNIAEGIGVINSEGQARLESKHFSLYLPADGDWGYNVNGNNAVEIYYTPAYEAGYGGTLVTIVAFDWGDNGYADYPSYTVAGQSADKKYIAVFPTDVQYAENQADGYNNLAAYVRRIDNSEDKAADNPFICLDN